MVVKPPPKQPVSCRVEADVLARLKAEAAEQGALFTLYIEACITNFKSVVEDLEVVQRNEELLSCQLTDSETEVKHLKHKNATQLQTIQKLSALCERLNAEIKALRDQKDVFQMQSEATDKKNTLLTTWAEELQEAVGHLMEKNQELQTEVNTKSRNEAALQNRVKSLSADNQNLNATIRLLQTEREALRETLNQRLPIWLTEKSVQRVKLYLDTIQKKYPSVSHEDLLVLSVATTARNEGHTFRMFNISDFQQKNPHFLTFQSPTLSSQ